MAGQVVIDDEHIPPLLHEVLSNAGGSVRSSVLQPGRLLARSHHHDAVFHRTMVPQLGDHSRYGGRPLADRTVDTDHILILLMQDGIKSDCSLPGLSVAQDELALTSADRDQGIQPARRAMGAGPSGRTSAF